MRLDERFESSSVCAGSCGGRILRGIVSAFEASAPGPGAHWTCRATLFGERPGRRDPATAPPRPGDAPGSDPEEVRLGLAFRSDPLGGRRGAYPPSPRPLTDERARLGASNKHRDAFHDDACRRLLWRLPRPPG